MAKIVKFPRGRKSSADPIYSDEVSQFVDDLGGFVLNLKAATHSTWEELAHRTGLNDMTLVRLADRKTKAPMFRTVYAILRALDERSLIRHSLFEKYRGFNRADAKRLDKSVAGMGERGRGSART
jgi:hypothetical protein